MLHGIRWEYCSIYKCSMMETETSRRISLGIHCVDRRRGVDAIDIAVRIGIHHGSTFACAPACTFPSGHTARTDIDSAGPILRRACCLPRMGPQPLLSLDRHSCERNMFGKLAPR